jgi:limonene 1,2-monooxygenase
MLCVAATQSDSFDVLGQNWQIANEIAQEERGVDMDRSVLRLVGPVHIAETREQARANVEFGIHKFIEYFSAINPMAAGQDMGGDDPVGAMIESGRAVIGTPDDAIEQLERLQKQTGGFGCFLQLAHNWANWEHTKKSYQLFARHVAPHFDQASLNRAESMRWAMDNSKEFIGAAMSAALETIQKHHQERGEKS